VFNRLVATTRKPQLKEGTIVKQHVYLRSTLALACLLAISEQGRAQVRSSPITLPLDVIVMDLKITTQERLGINVGVNGAAPKEYMFDTGSTAFNIAVGKDAPSRSWFPLLPGVPVNDAGTMAYGDGSYGNLVSTTNISSVQFYKKGDKTPSADYATAAGMPVYLATGYFSRAADENKADSDHKEVVGYWTAYDGMLTLDQLQASGRTVEDFVNQSHAVPVYRDAAWQENVEKGIGPQDDGKHDEFGIFGAGDFGNDSVLGNLTKSGYVVAANAQLGRPQNCTGCEHVILNLTPALRAQFNSLVSWSDGANGTYKLSGAPISASQYDLAFAYTLDNGKHSARLGTLLDSGTPWIMLNDAQLHNAEKTAGQIDANGLISTGNTLTATGIAAGAQPTSIQATDSDNTDYSNVVVTAPGNFVPPGNAIYGISFYFNNSVMYDLENKRTGYTPFFVSVDPISTNASGYKITNKMAPQGIAGVISGKGPVEVGTGGKAQLSGSNTYTGATLIDKGGWLGLAGPGSISASSGVEANGVFDVSRTDGTATVQSLKGNGTVALGGKVLELTNASGTFGGQLVDGGLGGGVGGGFIIASGHETLTGKNTFTDRLGIGSHASLDLQGSVTSSVQVGGLLSGGGFIGRDLLVLGTVVPGDEANKFQKLSVEGAYHQVAGSTLLTQIDAAGHASQVAVKGAAVVDAGANLGAIAVAPTGNALYTRGTQYTVLTSGQKLTGTYQTTTAPITAMLGLVPTYDARHVYVSVVQTRPLIAAAQTSNQKATLAGVQSLSASNKLFAGLVNAPTDPAIRRSADTLSGEIYQSTSALLLDHSQVIRDAVSTRLLAMQPDAVGADPAGNGSAEDHGLTSWGHVIDGRGHRDGDGNASRMTDHSSGFVVGADLPLGDSARVGVTGGRERIGASSLASSNTANANSVGV
jgi:subtilase-type serine protease